MAQLDFYFSIEEKNKLVELVFEKKGVIAVDSDYLSPCYTILKNMHEYRDFAESNNIFYILHEDYVKYPLQFSTFNRDNQTFYYINQKYGGPYIDIYTTGLLENNRIETSNIHYYPYYYVDKETQINPTHELLDFYNSLTKFIRKNSLPYKMTVRKYWIGKQLIQDVINDKVVLLHIPKCDLLKQINIQKL